MRISKILFIGLLLLVLVESACKKDLPITTLNDPAIFNDPLQVQKDSILKQMEEKEKMACMDFNAYIKNVPFFTNPAAVQDKVFSDTSTSNADGLRCTTYKVKWAPMFNEHFLTSPTNTFHPGMIFDGNTILTGGYKTIQAKRDSMLISISLPTKPGTKSSIWIKNPNSIAEVRQGINQLLNNVVEGGTAAYINFDIQEVKSDEEVTIGLNATVSGWGQKVKGTYDFNESSRKSRFLIRFQQVYYTVDMDPVILPCKMFNPIPTVQEAEQLFAGTSPVYISSMRYGRMIYYMVESDSAASKTKKTLEAGFKAWGANLDAKFSDEDKSVMEATSISALIVGGSADGAVKAIDGIDQIREFIKDGGDVSTNNIGVPISYTLNFVSDGSIANVVVASEYTLRECEVVTEDITITPDNTPKYFCADRVNQIGDNEFDGNGPEVDGKFILSEENGDIYMTIDVNFKEGGTLDLTEGAINKKIKIAKVPVGKVFVRFTDGDTDQFFYTDSQHDIDKPTINGGGFVYDLQVLGDTSGEDLGCSKGEDAQIEFRIKPFRIAVRNQ
jgi:hypothetical protein